MVNYVCVTILQRRTLPPRACAEQSATYCEILRSDDEGSDYDEDLSGEVSVEDADYDPEAGNANAFDYRKGDDNWIGRRVVKTFGEHGDFEGIVYAVDDDENKTGFRLFLVHYFDDPDDGEGMWPVELSRFVYVLLQCT